MKRLSQISPEHREAGAMSSLVPIEMAVDEHTFLTKRGDLVQILSIEGPDAECRDASQIEDMVRRFEAATRLLGEECRLYQYLVKQPESAIPARTYDHPVVDEAVRRRIRHLQKSTVPLYRVATHFAVVYERGSLPATGQGSRVAFSVGRLLDRFSPKKQIGLLDGALEQAQQTLEERVHAFIVQLPEAVKARVLGKQEAFQFLRMLLNYADPVDNVSLKYDECVDYQLCCAGLECHRSHLRLQEHFAQVLTLKEPPSRTFAHMFRELLAIPCSFIAVTEWKQVPTAQIRRLIRSKRRHYHNTKISAMNYLPGNSRGAPDDVLVDDAARGHVAELGRCLEEIDLSGRAFGQFSWTFVVFDEDLAAVHRGVAELRKVFGAHDAVLLDERYNALNAWAAVLPGNRAYNVRRLWLTESNHADLSFLFGLHTGERENPHLGTEYLAVFETNQGTPYFFNCHHKDNAHTLVLGASGSGKSFLLNFLVTHAQKYRPFTCIFDLGGSYENLTRLFGGTCLRIGVEEQSVRINPFALSPTPENLHFLYAFLKVLVEGASFQMTASEDQDLYEQLNHLYAVETPYRRLQTLSQMLGRRLRLQLEKWVDGGPFAHVFDHVEDSLRLARFQTFDFEGIGSHPEVLEALLFYILHRANAAVYDPAEAATFKLVLIDEAWRFFRHPAIQLYIVEALKTWRKKNAALILASQSSEDLARSEILPIVVESCATKIFLANPDLDPTVYRELFHLNDCETRWIAELVAKQQILINRPDGSRVVQLHVSDEDYWLYTSSPRDRVLRDEAVAQHGFPQALEILSRRFPR